MYFIWLSVIFLILVIVIIRKRKEKENYFWGKIVILYLSLILTFKIGSIEIPLGIIIGYLVVIKASKNNISLKKITLSFALVGFIFINYIVPPIELNLQTEEDEIVQYLANSMDYHEISTKFNNGIVNIEYPMVNIREDLVKHQTLIIILHLKDYAGEDNDLFKVVNFRYFEKGTNKTVAEVKVKGDTFIKTDWNSIDSFMFIPQYVDHYKFKGTEE